MERTSISLLAIIVVLHVGLAFSNLNGYNFLFASACHAALIGVWMASSSWTSFLRLGLFGLSSFYFLNSTSVGPIYITNTALAPEVMQSIIACRFGAICLGSLVVVSIGFLALRVACHQQRKPQFRLGELLSFVAGIFVAMYFWVPHAESLHSAYHLLSQWYIVMSCARDMVCVISISLACLTLLIPLSRKKSFVLMATVSVTPMIETFCSAYFFPQTNIEVFATYFFAFIVVAVSMLTVYSVVVLCKSDRSLNHILPPVAACPP